MLEVYRREILDNVAARNAGIEKVLRLFDESDNSEKYCQLRGDWERTEVEHGDIVNIVGEAIVYPAFFPVISWQLYLLSLLPTGLKITFHVTPVMVTGQFHWMIPIIDYFFI